jgi:hypothetical protein
MEEEELYKRVIGILRDIKEDRIKQAIVKTEEVLNYQIDEELCGRIRNVLGKLKAGSVDDAVVMMERVVEYLDKQLSTGAKTNAIPIADSEISVRVLYALDDLANFKRKDSIAKLKDLQKYDIGNYVYEVIEQSIQLLDVYDEVKAEKLLKQLLEDLKAAPASELSKQGVLGTEKKAPGQGYHSTLNK